MEEKERDSTEKIAAQKKKLIDELLKDPTDK
jgi:hypothetical protein